MPNVPLRYGGPKARIAVIPGDGIGKEVIPVAVNVIRAAIAKRNRPIEFVEFDWGADKFLRERITLPPGAVEMLRDEFDAILFGALGDPRVPSNQHAADILLGLRFKLDLYVNARPTELLHERFTPLRNRTAADIRLMVFRENTEGLYVGAGGFFQKGTPDEIAIQEDVNTRKGVERIIRYAFEYARSHTRESSAGIYPGVFASRELVVAGLQTGKRADAGLPSSQDSEASPALPDSKFEPRTSNLSTQPITPPSHPPTAPLASHPITQGCHPDPQSHSRATAVEGSAFSQAAPPLRLCMADKSNAMTFAGGLWQRLFQSVRAEYPDIDSRHLYIDTLAMELIRDPGQFDVIVTNNLFGDIISDLASQLGGGLGLAPSGNIHPGRTSLFEPVHGSAPNIAGKGIANPFGSVLSSAMMLEFLGWPDEAAHLKQSVKSALEQNVATPDLGGSKSTLEVADWLLKHVSSR